MRVCIRVHQFITLLPLSTHHRTFRGESLAGGLMQSVLTRMWITCVNDELEGLIPIWGVRQLSDNRLEGLSLPFSYAVSITSTLTYKNSDVNICMFNAEPVIESSPENTTIRNVNTQARLPAFPANMLVQFFLPQCPFLEDVWR